MSVGSSKLAGDVVVFGVSNMLGDIFDCALALGHRISRVVLNQPEVLRPRTKPAAERIGKLADPPETLSLDAYEPRDNELHVLGTTSPARDELVALLEDRFKIRFATLVHPTAYVSPLAVLSDGVFIGAKSVVAPGVEIGEHVFVNRAVSIGHDCVIEAFARLQPGSNIGGHVRIGRGTTIGIGASVIQEVSIGANVQVAAGAVVIGDVGDESIMVGVPARMKN